MMHVEQIFPVEVADPHDPRIVQELLQSLHAGNELLINVTLRRFLNHYKSLPFCLVSAELNQVELIKILGNRILSCPNQEDRILAIHAVRYLVRRHENKATFYSEFGAKCLIDGLLATLPPPKDPNDDLGFSEIPMEDHSLVVVHECDKRINAEISSQDLQLCQARKGEEEFHAWLRLNVNMSVYSPCATAFMERDLFSILLPLYTAPRTISDPTLAISLDIIYNTTLIPANVPALIHHPLFPHFAAFLQASFFLYPATIIPIATNICNAPFFTSNKTNKTENSNFQEKVDKQESGDSPEHQTPSPAVFTFLQTVFDYVMVLLRRYFFPLPKLVICDPTGTPWLSPNPTPSPAGPPSPRYMTHTADCTEASVQDDSFAPFNQKITPYTPITRFILRFIDCFVETRIGVDGMKTEQRKHNRRQRQNKQTKDVPSLELIASLVKMILSDDLMTEPSEQNFDPDTGRPYTTMRTETMHMVTKLVGSLGPDYTSAVSCIKIFFPICFQTLRSFVSLRVQERTAVTLLTLLLISNDIMPSFVLSSNLDSLLISLLSTFVREHTTSQTETPNSVANHTLPAKVESGHSACEDSLRDDELTVHLLLALLSHYVNILSKQLTGTFTDLSGESSEHLVPDDWLPSLGPNEVDDGWDDAVGGEYGAETDHFDGNSDVPEVKRMVSWKRTILMVELSKLFPESTMIQSDIFTILQQASLASRMSGAPVKLSSSVSRALCLNATRTLRNDDLSTHMHSLSILGWLQENIHTCVSMISESPSAFFPLTALLTPSVHSASPRHCDMALYLISELLTNYQRHCRPDHLHLPADAGESDDYVSIALSPTDFVPHTPSPSAPLPHPLNSPQHLWSNFEGEYHRMMLALLERERMGIVMMVAQKLRGEGGRPEVFVSALIQSLADETIPNIVPACPIA